MDPFLFRGALDEKCACLTYTSGSSPMKSSTGSYCSLFFFVYPFFFVFKCIVFFLQVLTLNQTTISNNFQVYDAVALQLCLSALAPHPEEFDDPQTRLVWCNRVLAVRPSVENLLNSSTTCGEKTTLVLRDCRSVVVENS